MIGYLLLSGGGGKTAAVPSVVGQTQQAAVTAVKNAGLTPKVVMMASASVKKDTVISSNPQFGTKVAPKSVVTLNVSTGPGKVKVPSVVGESETTAQNQLQNFHVVTKTDANSTKPAGTVVRQNPTGGTLALPGSTVTIWVSGGGTQVQNVVGDPQNTAIQILQGQGFKVHTIVTAGPANSTPGNVFQQNPANGTLPAGSTVTIYVASTPTPTPDRHHARRPPRPRPRRPRRRPPPRRPRAPPRARRVPRWCPGVTLSRATEQETTVPKSRVRSKAVYTPPPKRSASKKVSPRWLVPAMLTCLMLGLAWIAVFYVTQGSLPIGALADWNLVVGFAFIIAGVVLSTKWR